MEFSAAHKIVAIDGPAASGKSSVAQELARRLGFVYVNSGAMYRTMTWYVLERGIAADDATAIEQSAQRATITCRLRDHDSFMLIDGVDAGPFLREDRVNENVSRVSGVPRVREILAKHGWFQTVLSDLPHFTFLGLKEKDLSKNGLKNVEVDGQTFWIPNVVD